MGEGKAHKEKTRALPKLAHNGAQARHIIAHEAFSGKAIASSVILLEDAVAGSAKPSDEWESTRFKRGIAGWAAAALLGELAREHSLHDRILKTKAVTVLEILSRSPDPLESAHATQALHRLLPFPNG